jgi:hypothetical protein
VTHSCHNIKVLVAMIIHTLPHEGVASHDTVIYNKIWRMFENSLWSHTVLVWHNFCVVGILKKGYTYKSLQKFWREIFWRLEINFSLWNCHEIFFYFNEANELPNCVKAVKFNEFLDANISKQCHLFFICKKSK